MNWSGHWHGYGPWIGAASLYAKEGGRRPAHSNGPPMVTDPEDRKQQQVLDRYREAAAEFQTGNVPPLMTGHWLMKQDQAAAERTWTDVGIALAWMTKNHEANRPFERPDGRRAYVGLDGKLAYAADVLPRGVDVCWVHYTTSKNLFSLSVVCCPNRFHPEIPCPLPPS
ncbi:MULTISPECIES: hypothetical protein [Streptomyces]|uniref:Uncharacterized protein n=1 Tax=Streptomyces sudanensis TaxID=436397 RepID=A0ABY4TGD0_9ACTN|nr:MULTISPECIES: hypothetical protein [Streptomyces]URN16621.1 hypothetical protein MW084_12480 [Streptomyces sudanensis]